MPEQSPLAALYKNRPSEDSQLTRIFYRPQAPEYPYPFAIDEMYDAYTLLHQTKGRCIGMNRNGEKDLKVLLTGDSA